MQSGIRQRLLLILLIALFVAASIAGAYRYYRETEAILAAARQHGEQSAKLIAEIAAPLLMAADYGSLRAAARNFLRSADTQEVMISDSEGREIVRAARPDLAENRITLGPFPIAAAGTRLGEMRLSVYPAGLAPRLRSCATDVLVEYAFLFCILAPVLYFSLSRTVVGPLHSLEAGLKGIIAGRDVTRRLDAGGGGELGSIADGVNTLLGHLRQTMSTMAAIAARISGITPRIASACIEMQQNADDAETNAAGVVTSAGTLSSSVRTVAENAESLFASAEAGSSAMLQMNASNQEVLRHTTQLTASVEEVTTSVLEMIASIREVAAHADTLSSAAEETAASASEIEATVREVEQAARESSRLSEQVSVEAREIGVRSVEQITVAMNKIKDSMNSYAGLVTRLGKRSEEIGKILGVIVDVTERTNLLALNASILAAQAGEHGKGFAVVAEEIKALADRTAGSTQDIAKLIASVQKETREAVAAMGESMNAVEEGVRRSADAGNALSKILASSARSAETATMIERAMTEQSRGVRQVSGAVENIKQMMNQIAAATQAQTTGTDMILTASEGMQDIARQVHHAMTEQEQGGKQIAEAAGNVSLRAGQIAASTRDQGEVSGRILDAMGQMQDLPRQNKQRMASLREAVKELEEQSELLNRELGAHGRAGVLETPKADAAPAGRMQC